MPRKRPIQDCESLIDWLIKNWSMCYMPPIEVQNRLRAMKYEIDIDVIKKTMVRAKAKKLKLDADRRLRSMATSVNKSERIRQVLASEQGLTPAEVRDRLAEQNVYVTIDLIKTVRRNAEPGRRKGTQAKPIPKTKEAKPKKPIVNDDPLPDSYYANKNRDERIEIEDFSANEVIDRIDDDEGYDAFAREIFKTFKPRS